MKLLHGGTDSPVRTWNVLKASMLGCMSSSNARALFWSASWPVR